MKGQATKARAKQVGKKQAAPLTRLVVTDALRTWVIPTVAAAVGVVMYILYNIGLVEQAPAVTVTGTLVLATILFYGLRGFLEDELEGRRAALLIGFAVLWAAVAFYPFYRAVNPGPPVFSTELTREAGPVTVPLHGKAGHYSLLVEGHFLPAQGKENRAATYHIAVGHDTETDRVLEGTFRQEWGTQRVGSGRRSSLVPVMHQTTLAVDAIDDPDGRDLTLKLTDLSPGVRDAVTVRLYAEGVPKAVWMVLGALTLGAAVVVDTWRPKGSSDGLMGTLTVAALIGLVVFRTSTATAPGFPQLIIAALVGALGGAVGGTLLWRLTPPIRRYVH